MLYIRIELWPGGNKAAARLLQEIKIANDGTGDAARGNYEATISHATTFRGNGFKDPVTPHPDETWKVAAVKGFRRALSPAALLRAVLVAARV